MPGHGPTVVEGPDDPFAGLLQIVKEQPHVDIIAVEVVQVDDVGVKLPYPLKEYGGGPAAGEACVVQQSGAGRVAEHIRCGADADGVFFRPFRQTIPGVGDFHFMPRFFQPGSQIGADAPGASRAAADVDHQNSHVRSSSSRFSRLVTKISSEKCSSK